MSRARTQRIRILRALAGPSGVYEPGRVYEVPVALARAWIEQGLAEEDTAVAETEVETTDARRSQRSRRSRRRASQSD